MSAVVPYVAPWQTEFEKYSVQLYTPGALGANALTMTVPVGQWWRVIYLSAVVTTGVTAGGRIVVAEFSNAAGALELQVGAAGAQTASSVGTYLFGPSLTAFANTTLAGSQVYTTALPDLLWGPSTTIDLNLSGIAAGDSWAAAPRTFAIEVYSEDRPGVLVPITPTPLIA